MFVCLSQPACQTTLIPSEALVAPPPPPQRHQSLRLQIRSPTCPSRPPANHMTRSRLRQHSAANDSQVFGAARSQLPGCFAPDDRWLKCCVRGAGALLWFYRSSCCGEVVAVAAARTRHATSDEHAAPGVPPCAAPVTRAGVFRAAPWPTSAGESEAPHAITGVRETSGPGTSLPATPPSHVC